MPAAPRSTNRDTSPARVRTRCGSRISTRKCKSSSPNAATPPRRTFLSSSKAAARNVIGILLAIFIVAISINLARDNAIDCGCFNVADRGKTHEQRIFDMKVDVARDLGMLLMVAQLWWAGKREEDEA